METALAQIATWCDTADPSDMRYFAHKIREYLLDSAEDDGGNSENIMAEMVAYLAAENYNPEEEPG